LNCKYTAVTFKLECPSTCCNRLISQPFRAQWIAYDYQSQLETLVALSVPQPAEEPPSRWQRFKDWLRSTPEEEEPAKKEETPVERL
jgi:hypothetical protein